MLDQLFRVRAGGHRDGVLVRVDHAVLHRLQVPAGAQHRGGLHHRARHEHHRRRGPRAGVHLRPRARHLRRRLLRLLARPDLRAGGQGGGADWRAVRHGGGHHGHAEHGGVRAHHGRLRAHRGQRRRHRGDEPAARERARDHRPAGRRREHHQGHHQGVRHRIGGAGGVPAVQRVHGRGELLHRQALHQRGHRGAGGVDRRPAWVDVGVPVQQLRVQRGGAVGAGGGERGARPVPAAPRHHDLPGEARLRALRLHGGRLRPARDDQAGAAGRLRPGGHRAGVPGGGVGDGAGAAGGDGGGLVPDVRHGERHPHGALPEQRGGGLGQRQEVRRDGRLRGEGLRGAQGGRHGGHGWGPVQGHRGALHPCAHQDACDHHPGHGSSVSGLSDCSFTTGRACATYNDTPPRQPARVRQLAVRVAGGQISGGGACEPYTKRR
mmetsp:Transcript_25532/g.55491  ORF Transcript_25532/g.55491 Transcript_25532/m.55491 type:complete len:436 (+) Transcript_25532:1455-2762(+)